MQGKVIVVTGSNRGIGKGIVRKLFREAPEYTNIVLTALDIEEGLAAKAEITDSGRITVAQLDITDQESIDSFVTLISNAYGQIDTLINNAAIVFQEPLLTDVVAKQTMDVNIYGTMNFTDCMLPYIKDGGHIINVSSHQGFCHHINSDDVFQKIMNPNLTRSGIDELIKGYIKSVRESHEWSRTPYGMSKVFLNCYTRVLAKELAPRNIRVNALCPGYIATDMTQYRGTGTIEEGAKVPFTLARYTGDISGSFWKDSGVVEWH